MQGRARKLRCAAVGALLLGLGGQAAAQAKCPLSEDDMRTFTGMYVAGIAGFGASLAEGSRPQALGFLLSRAMADVPQGSETRACLERMDAVLQAAFEEHGNAVLNGYVAGYMGLPPADDPFRGHDTDDLIAAIEDWEAEGSVDAEAIATEWELVDMDFVASGKSYPTNVVPGMLRLSLDEDGSLYRSEALEGGDPVLASGTWSLSPEADSLTMDVEGENPDTLVIETLTRDRLVLVKETEHSLTRLVFDRIPDD